MTPAFRIAADGRDATAPIADRLLSLRVTDEAGLQADELEIALDNRDDRIAPPRRGAVLTLALGFSGQPLTEMGRFVVTATRGAGPVRTLSVIARAADFDGPIRAPRTRVWRTMSFGAVARAIAEERGLTPRVAPAFDAPVLASVEQAEESDLNLLARLADDAGALATIKGGALVVVREGAGETADGRPIPPVAVRAAEASAWSWSIEDRDAYRAVRAFWTDLGAAERRPVTVGETTDEAPVFEIRRVFATEQEALQAARARLARLARGAGSLSIDLAGFSPGLTADAPVRAVGFDAAADGDWRAIRVEHALDAGGLTTRLEAELTDRRTENA